MNSTLLKESYSMTIAQTNCLNKWNCARRIDDLILEHHKQTNVLLENKTEELKFLCDENKRLEENEINLLKEIQSLKEQLTRFTNDKLNRSVDETEIKINSKKRVN